MTEKLEHIQLLTSAYFFGTALPEKNSKNSAETTGKNFLTDIY